jgi:uncharacterized protein (TIGR02246 family)
MQSLQHQTEDEQAIRNVERARQDAWNRNDMEALTILLTEDVDFRTVAGHWLLRRLHFKERHAWLHGMQFKDSVWTIDDDTIRLLKPDIAPVHVRCGMVGNRNSDGTPQKPRRGIFTQVMVTANGQWLTRASQSVNALSEPKWLTEDLPPEPPYAHGDRTAVCIGALF